MLWAVLRGFVGSMEWRVVRRQPAKPESSGNPAWPLGATKTDIVRSDAPVGALQANYRGVTGSGWIISSPGGVQAALAEIVKDTTDGFSTHVIRLLHCGRVAD